MPRRSIEVSLTEAGIRPEGASSYSPFGYYVVNHQSHEVIVADPTFLKIWGLTDISREDRYPREISRAAFQKVAARPTPDIPETHDFFKDENINAKGKTIRTVSTRIHDEDGYYLATLYMFQDITNQGIRIVSPSSSKTAEEEAIEAWQKRQHATISEATQLIPALDVYLGKDLPSPIQDELPGRDNQVEVETLDPTALYLRQIERIPLLTADQEISLAKIMKRSKGIIGKYPSSAQEALPPEIKKELNDAKIRYQKAKQRFIEANLRLVVHVAKKYLGRGLELLDLIQAGNEILPLTVDRFDETRGFRFSTYAVNWIRRQILAALENESRTVRLPRHVGDLVGKVAYIKHHLRQELGQEPTPEKIAEELGITAEKAAQAVELAKSTVSLDVPMDKENPDITFKDQVKDQTQNTAAQADRNVLRKDLAVVLADLSQAQREVLIHRFLGDLSHKEIGEKIGRSAPAVYSLQRKGLESIRKNPQAAQLLKDWLE